MGVWVVGEGLGVCMGVCGYGRVWDIWEGVGVCVGMVGVVFVCEVMGLCGWYGEGWDVWKGVGVYVGHMWGGVGPQTCTWWQYSGRGRFDPMSHSS